MQIDLSDIIYFPTQKWKQGEYTGAGALPEYLKDRMVPIFLMPPAGSFDNEDGKVLTPDEHIKSFGARLSANWGGRLCFIDAAQIDTPDYKRAAEGAHPLVALFERSRLYQPRGIVAPATTLDRTAEYQEAAARILRMNPELPACIRVRPEDLDGADVERLITGLLNKLGIEPERAVLVLDSADLEIRDTDAFSNLLANLINRMPFLHRWKKLVTAFCALPSDLKALPKQTTRFARTDWQVFQKLHGKAKAGQLLRSPIYSDYGTENATFAPARPVPPATQLRYTTNTEIAIFKGENTRTAGYAGIYPVAVRVMDDPAFAGGNFSEGDLEIETLATRPRSTGNASLWKKYGVIHHSTLVLTQLSALTGFSLVNVSEKQSPVQNELLPFFIETE